MTSDFGDRLRSRQQALSSRDLVRSVHSRASHEAVIDLAGNDYLGLATHPEVVSAATRALHTWGAGATASRVVRGTTLVHDEVERDLASLMQSDASRVFSSGYLANLGVITSLSDPGTLLVIDAHAHASLMDAARLARSEVVVSDHNDVDGVAKLLSNRRQPRAVVVTESVFSVDGDAAPLAALYDVCRSSDAVMVVDEAHAIGTAGQGRGLVVEAGLAGQADLICTATLSKALGGQGGVVAGSHEICDFLTSRARTFIYDTALAPASAAAASAAANLIVSQPERITRLRALVDRAATLLDRPVPAGAVLSLVVGGARETTAVAERARVEGVVVGSFRPPSVPDGRSRVRLTVRGDLSDDDLARGCRVVSDAMGAVLRGAP